MFKIILLINILVFQTSYSQSRSNSQIINVKEFNWTITIPKDFLPIQQKEWDKLLKKGTDAIENTIDEEIVNQAKKIFVYKNGKFNNIEANWQPYDVDIDGDYLKSNSAVYEILFETFKAQIPNAKLFPQRSKQKISGLQFQRYDIQIEFPNGLKMTTIMFSRLFDKKDFTVNLTYINEKIGKTMLDSFINSKFE
jgi:hypothetical protein